MRKLGFICAMTLALVSTVRAGDKKLMHCFAFTAVEGASPADWEAFYKATDQLTSKVPGVSHVWYGKLQNPMTLFQPDDKAAQELRAGAAKATGEITRVRRQYGVCMEMDSADTLKSYAAHPYHKVWEDAYSKVRVAGTTTINLIGQ